MNRREYIRMNKTDYERIKQSGKELKVKVLGRKIKAKYHWDAGRDNFCAPNQMLVGIEYEEFN